MAAVSRLLATKQPPFHLRPSLNWEDYSSVRITYTHVVTAAAGGNPAVTATRKQDLPFCPDSSDKERMVRCLSEFVDACDDARLHIHDAARYIEIRHILGGDLRSKWDLTSAAIPDADKTDANFHDHLITFLRKSLPANAFLLQQEYFNQAVKPMGIDCYECSGRLLLLNSLSAFLPGSAGNVLFTDDTSKKNAFYKLMLPDWQLTFTSAGHRLDDNAYTFDRLVDFMEQQRLFFDAMQESRRRRDAYNNQGQRYNNSYARGGGYSPGRFGSRAPPPGPPPPGGYGGGYGGHNRGRGGFGGYTPRGGRFSGSRGNYNPNGGRGGPRTPPRGNNPNFGGRGGQRSGSLFSPPNTRSRTGGRAPQPNMQGAHPTARRRLGFYQDTSQRRHASRQELYYADDPEEYHQQEGYEDQYHIDQASASYPQQYPVQQYAASHESSYAPPPSDEYNEDVPDQESGDMYYADGYDHYEQDDYMQNY